MLSEQILKKRKEAGLSQEALAEQLGVSRQAVSKWEVGDANPDIAYVMRMCEIFGISSDVLLFGEERRPKTDEVSKNVQEKKPPEKRLYPFILGMLLLVLGTGGIVVLGILSALHPWTAIVGQYVYEGLLGFVIGTKTGWLLILCILCALIGAVLSIIAVFCPWILDRRK